MRESRSPGSVRGCSAMGIPTAIGVPQDHSSLKNASEFDYSSFYVTTGTGTPAALLRRIWGRLTKGEIKYAKGEIPNRTAFSVLPSFAVFLDRPDVW